jgi:hypothetical protein
MASIIVLSKSFGRRPHADNYETMEPRTIDLQKTMNHHMFESATDETRKIMHQDTRTLTYNTLMELTCRNITNKTF